jgi:hypothetical protein
MEAEVMTERRREAKRTIRARRMNDDRETIKWTWVVRSVAYFAAILLLLWLLRHLL